MNHKHGGSSSSESRSVAIQTAREKLLAVYNSAVEGLKRPEKPAQPTANTTNPPAGIYSTPDLTVSNFDEQIYVDSQAQPIATTEPTPTPATPEPEAQPSYGPIYDQNQVYTEPAPTHTPSAIKDTAIQQAPIDEEWAKYHSAWQQYYQNYYSEYYAKAAENYIATEKLKNERIATGKEHQKKHRKRLIPIIAAASVLLVFLFLQYNRIIFAPIMAYVAPENEPVADSIEAIDPNITQSVSPEPRLIIPKLNIDVPVAFGINYNDVMEAMNHGVAHFMIPGASAFPGEIGNLVISGHSAGDIYSSNPYKFIFSGLERLSAGDLIYINFNSVRYTYRMTGSEVVEPSNVEALIYPTDKPMLTLITCTPLGTSRFRLLISAEQISPASGDSVQSTPDTTTTDVSMPSNEPSFLENIWSGLFGN